MSRSLAADAAREVRDAFDRYHDAFRSAARRSARHFEQRDWLAVRYEATARLQLYGYAVDRAIAAASARMGTAARDRPLWARMRDHYAGDVGGRDDQEIAETFFSSVTRRHFGTTGVAPDLEFQRPGSPETTRRDETASRRRCSGVNTTLLAREILAGIAHPMVDRDGDAERVGDAIGRAAGEVWGDAHVDEAEVLTSLFYRNKGAYLVGRLHRGGRTMPLALALLAGARGVYVDAVLTSTDEISIVFGFAWSYFHVDVASPAATVAFLQPLMPLKRVDELYTSIGYNKHGKTELYRALAHDLAHPDARFEDAPGAKGLVMSVFTLPSFNIVLKIVKDRIGAPKRTNRDEVMRQYRRVFLRDRVGRLADAQLFLGLSFRRECFSNALLAELLHDAPSTVRLDGAQVVLQHVYTERRVRPLNLYLQEVDSRAAEAAILDYGCAIEDLAAANIFPGDLLLKNFGVSRHGRVIFYDYDELATVTECRFRRLPAARSIDDELAPDPWFSVAEQDVFPEEFMPFLVPEGPLREAFLTEHRKLLDPDWWCALQDRLRAGDLVDTFPYPQERRLANRDE